MNERTKELYKQAIDYACESADPNNGWKNGKDFTENTNEKFAELIVRECIAQAVKEEERYDSLDERECDYCSMAMANFQGVLAKHFGVEE